MDLRKLLKAKDEAIPETGFNLVEVDPFARPGDGLTVLAHYSTRSEAEREMARYKRENPGVRVAILASTDY